MATYVFHSKYRSHDIEGMPARNGEAFANGQLITTDEELAQFLRGRKDVWEITGEAMELLHKETLEAEEKEKKRQAVRASRKKRRTIKVPKAPRAPKVSQGRKDVGEVGSSTSVEHATTPNEKGDQT